MEIHVVKPGESVYSIAREYGIQTMRPIADNELRDPSVLAVGQTLVILPREQIYAVRDGDTLTSIAARYGTTVNALYRNNPMLGGLPNIVQGQVLVISYEEEKFPGSYTVMGYAYPFIDRAVFRKTLPYLTYANLFTYGFTPDGTLVVPDDAELTGITAEYPARPLLVFSTLTPQGTFNSGLSTLLFRDEDLRGRVIGALMLEAVNKNYAGIDVDFEYIPGDSREGYVAFIRQLADALHGVDKILTVALAPKTSDGQAGLLYEGIDYAALGGIADYVLIMTYEYGYTYGPPMAVSPLNEIRRVAEYAVSRIEPGKVLLGVPNYGYDWKLPYVRGESKAESISNVEAVERAVAVGAEIAFDETAMSPYYTYTSGGAEHIVWFEDARSVRAKLELMRSLGLGGAGYWNIMRYFPQNWLVLNALVNIRP